MSPSVCLVRDEPFGLEDPDDGGYSVVRRFRVRKFINYTVDQCPAAFPDYLHDFQFGFCEFLRSVFFKLCHCFG